MLGAASFGDWIGLLATGIFASAQFESSAAQGAAFGGTIAVRLLPALLLGPIAGVFADAAWPMTDTPLRQGDTIVLYTDGVLDTVGDRDRFGDERLLALLAGAPADPTAVVARIDAALADFQAGPQRDDTAIVAITVDDVHATP